MEETFILDLGSYSIKYGNSGFASPKNIIKIFSKDCIENGVVTNWDKIDPFIEQAMEYKPENTKNILLTEGTINSEKNRQKACEIMFEKYNFEKCGIISQQLLALYGMGKNSGLVVDLGHHTSYCVPIYEGYILEKGVYFSPRAGDMVTKYIQQKINDDTISYNTSNKVKERIFGESKKFRKLFRLKNGKTYRAKDFNYKDTLFKGENSIQSTIRKSILNCDVDTKKDIYSNIILAGGTSLLNQIDSKIFDLIHHSIDHLKPGISAYFGREHASWIGGSIIGSMKNIVAKFKTKESY